MPQSPRAIPKSRRPHGRAPHCAAALALAAFFALGATPAHALPGEAGWFRWLSAPLGRLVSLFDLEGAYIDPNGRPAPATSEPSGPVGLFAQEGAYIDPNGKPAPPPVPVVFENHDQ